MGAAADRKLSTESLDLIRKIDRQARAGLEDGSSMAMQTSLNYTRAICEEILKQDAPKADKLADLHLSRNLRADD